MIASAPSKIAVATSENLGARRYRGRDHRFEHLRRDHDRLSRLAGHRG